VAMAAAASVADVVATAAGTAADATKL